MPQRLRRTAVAAAVLALAGVAPQATAQQSLSRTFELLPGERASIPFALTSPGKVVVSVQARGEALVLSITGADGQVQEQNGTGTFSFTVDVPASRAVPGPRLWSASLRTARAYTPPPTGSAGAPKPTAIGTLSVSGPIASEADMAPLVKAQGAALRSQLETERLAASRGTATDPSAAVRAALAQRTASAHAQQLQALNARLSPATQATIQQRGGMSVTRSIDPAAAGRLAVPGVRQPAATQPPATSSTTPSGANGVAIRSMSVTQGDPGTPVLFEGTGFGSTAGEVHFIVANGRDLKAPVTAWTDTQILSQVPAADSLPAFSGYAYVQRADGTRTPMQAFAFKPMLATVRYCIPGNESDVRIAQPAGERATYRSTRHPDDLNFFGFTGYDEYYVQTRLRNGWQAVEAQVASPFGCALLGASPFGAGGAYIVETRLGTDSPYVKVRWWIDGMSSIMYQVAVTLQGPSGLPYR